MLTRALYIDSSAFIKSVVMERDSAALRAVLASHPAHRVSSALLRAEALRAVRHLDSAAMSAIRAGLRRIELIVLDDRILEAAGTLEPRILRTLDAIHVATALALGDDLEAIVTYDERMVESARLLGLPMLTPR